MRIDDGVLATFKMRSGWQLAAKIGGGYFAHGSLFGEKELHVRRLGPP